MTSTPANEPPFALDGAVTSDKLLELIGVQTELKWLDLKRECDIDKTPGRGELAKDVGAMQIAGGYLLIGVDDDGTVVGISAGHARLFDEATLRGKLDAYLGPGYDIRSKVHAIQVDTNTGNVEQDVAIVWVAPHPDGCNVFRAVGNYATGERNKQETAFRAGDVYARHGSKSEPWNQADRAEANARRDAAAKNQWRAESADDFAQALHAATTASNVTNDPSGTYTWTLDGAGFEAGTVELLRRDDDVPVKRMLRAAQAEVRRLVADPVGRVSAITNPTVSPVADPASGGEPAAADELATVLDRLVTVAGLALDLDRPRYYTMVT